MFHGKGGYVTINPVLFSVVLIKKWFLSHSSDISLSIILSDKRAGDLLTQKKVLESEWNVGLVSDAK